MLRLVQGARGRDNNFNLIRMLAALAVFVSHAWPVTGGPGRVEPLVAATGYSLGTLAVFVFFAISGFFVSASWARAASAADFLAARALRLLPALAASLLAVLLILGPLVTSLPVAAYLADPETARFLPRNLTLFSAQFTLPGVFADNPYPKVEGSIWTLAYEAECYALVLLAGLTGPTRHRRAMAAAFAGYALLWVLGGLLPLPHRLTEFRLLSLPFVLGMAAFHWRESLALSLPVAILLAVLAALARGTPLGYPALVAALAYATFWLGLLPIRALRRYNRLGDYSYGFYLIAFPVQGLTVWLAGPTAPLVNVALSLPLALGLAVLSWHAVERPALALRHVRRRPAAT